MKKILKSISNYLTEYHLYLLVVSLGLLNLTQMVLVTHQDVRNKSQVVEIKNLQQKVDSLQNIIKITKQQ
jgi:hypothetical protein